MLDNRHYVYQIIDPRDKKILYIGKGTGGRCYFHFTISRKTSSKSDEKLFGILEHILDMTDYTQFDCIQILYSKLSDKEAKKIELDLIKSIGYENLYNVSTKAGWMNGSKWMNNGIIDRQFLSGEDIPTDFCYRGRIKNKKWVGRNKGTIWVTDGKVNKMIKKELGIPDGFFRGRTTIQNNG